MPEKMTNCLPVCICGPHFMLEGLDLRIDVLVLRAVEDDGFGHDTRAGPSALETGNDKEPWKEATPTMPGKFWHAHSSDMQLPRSSIRR